MAGQDIMDLTFDVPKAKRSGDAITKILDDVYASAERLDGKRIAIGNVDGLAELKKVQADIKKGYTDLNTSIDGFNKKLIEINNTSKQATETAKQQTEASKQATEAKKQETEQSKQQTETSKQSTEQSKQSASAKVADAKASTENARQKDIETKTTITLSKEQERQQKVAERQAKITRDNSDEYKLFVKEVNEAALAAKRLQFTQPGSPEATAATAKAAALKKQLTELNESTGNFTDNVGNYAGKIGGLFSKAYGYIRTAANILPGLGLSGIFLLGFEAIMKVVEALGFFSTAEERAIETSRKLNDIKREELEIDKQIEDTYKSRLNLESQTNKTAQSRENELNIAKAENKAKAELLQIEKGLADARALQANQTFNEKGGFDKEEQARGDLIKAQQDYEQKKTFLETLTKDGSISMLGNQTEADADDIEKAKKSLEESKKIITDKIKLYNEVKGINEENAGALAAQSEKEIEIQTYTEAQRRKLILEGIRVEQDLIKDRNSKILSDQRSTLAERLSAIKSNLTAQKAIIQAEKNNVLTDPSSSSADKSIAIKKALADNIKANRDAQKQMFDIRLDFLNRSLQAIKETQDIELNTIKAHNQEIINDTQRTADERLNAQSKSAEAERSLIENDYEEQKRQLDLRASTAEEYRRLEADREAKLIQLSSDTQKAITQILRDEIDKRKADNDEYLSYLASDNNNKTSADYAAEVTGLNKSFQQRLIGLAEYELQRKHIEDKYKVLRLKDDETEIRSRLNVLYSYKAAQQKITDDIIDLSSKMSDATTDEERDAIQKQIAEKQRLLQAYKGINQQILDNETALNDNIVDQNQQAIDKQIEAEQMMKEVKKKLKEELYNLFVTIGDAGYENELNNIQDIEDKQQTSYEHEVERINVSSATQAEKDQQLKILAVQRQAQEERNERSKREIQMRQARFDRDANALKIFGDAVAAHFTIIKQLGPVLGLPVAIANDILAAVQIGALYVKPLPKFESGTGYAPEGDALVDELGPELFINPRGELSYGSDKGAHVQYVEKGTKIVPHDEVNEYLQNLLLKQQAKTLDVAYNLDFNNATQMDFNPLERKMDALIHAYKNRPVIENHITAGGIKRVAKEGLSETEYIDRNVRGKG